MKRIMLFVILITLIFTSNTYARTYKIGVVPWAGFSPADVAEVKGFWKALGVDVQVISHGNNIEMKTAFINKRVDFAIEITGVWTKLYTEGIPLTILAETDWSYGGDKLIIKKDIDVNTLKGKPIGVFSDSVLPLVHRYFSSHGLRLSDVRLVELDVEALADNFISNRLQAIVCYDPNAIRAEKEGNGIIAATSASYPGCIADSFVARSDVLKTIPKSDVVNIFKGWIEAVNWINDESNWDEYKDILNKKTFQADAPYTDEALKDMCSGVHIHNPEILQKTNQKGGSMFTYIEEFKTILKENNMLRKDFTPEEIFDNTAIMEALK